jgi:hypothetical protein
MKIVAGSPERYVVRVKAADSTDFPVASDGRVTINVPRLLRACSVYLFDRIRISSGVQPLTTKSIQLLGNSNVATRLSLAEITKLPLDMLGAARKGAIPGGIVRSQRHQRKPPWRGRGKHSTAASKVSCCQGRQGRCTMLGAPPLLILVDERQHTARGVSSESTAPPNCSRHTTRAAAASKITHATAQLTFNALALLDGAGGYRLELNPVA